MYNDRSHSLGSNTMAKVNKGLIKSERIIRHHSESTNDKQTSTQKSTKQWIENFKRISRCKNANQKSKLRDPNVDVAF